MRVPKRTRALAHTTSEMRTRGNYNTYMNGLNAWARAAPAAAAAAQPGGRAAQPGGTLPWRAGTADSFYINEISAHARVPRILENRMSNERVSARACVPAFSVGCAPPSRM